MQSSRRARLLNPLLSRVVESAAPAIAQGDPIHVERYIAANRQLVSRDTIALNKSERDYELAETERRFDAIRSMHHFENDSDGQPIPHWAQIFQQQTVAAFQQQENRFVQLENRFVQLENWIAQQALSIRVVQQGTQQALNRGIRSIHDALQPVIRVSDGTFPADFPATIDEILSTEDEARIDALLLFYDLDLNEELAQRALLDLDPNQDPAQVALLEKKLRLQWFLGYNF